MFLDSVNFKYRATTWLILLLLLAIIIPTSFAQQQYRCGVNIMQTIEYGDTFRDAVDYNQAAFYCFDAERGDVVTVRVTPIGDSGGNLVANLLITKGVNEDEQAILDNAFASQVATVPLETLEVSVPIDADNTYMIMVVGNPGTRGEFELSLQVEQSQGLLGGGSTDTSNNTDSSEVFTDTTNVCELEGVVILSYGERRNVEITADFPQALFCFEGQVGDYAQIHVGNLEGGIIPFVVIGDPIATAEGNTIYAQAISNSIEEVAQLVHELPADGSYLIAVGPANNAGGSFFIELGTTEDAPVEYSCDNEPLYSLSHSQWGVSNEDESMNVLYNIGCTNTMIMNIFGGNFILEYRINSEGTFIFTMGDNEYTTVSLDEDSWVLRNLDDEEITLERISNEACDESPLSELLRGAWIIDGGNLFLIDFMCNGVAFIVNQDTTATASYTLEDGAIEIVIPSGQVIFSGEIEIDGNAMILRDAAGEINFVNTLTSSE